MLQLLPMPGIHTLYGRRPDEGGVGCAAARRRSFFRGEGASTGSEEREADAREAVSLSLSHPLLPKCGALFRK